MSSSEEASPGRSASMAQSIISMCRRTWSQERRIGVLLRAIEPPLSVWDCVPECIIDAHLKDAFEYHSDQRDYLLFYAIPASAVLRCIRRLEGYRASPLVLKSLHFFSHEKDIDAYNFPPESDFTADFSDSEYGEDSIISREWTLSPTSISELDDSDIHTTPQTHNSKLGDETELEDEVVRCKPQQLTEYPESEGFEVCTAPLQQSASDVDDEASSLEPRLLPTAHQTYTESDDDLKDHEPLEANSPEPQPFSPVHQSSPESDDDLKDDEPFEASSSELRLLSPVHPSYTESDDDLKDHEPLEANSPEPQPFSPVHQPSPEFGDSLKDDEPLEISSSEQSLLSPVNPYYEDSGDELKDDEPLEVNNSEPRPFYRVHNFYPQPDDGQKDDEPLEANNSVPRPFSGVHQFYPVFDDSEEDEPLTAESLEPRPFYRVHNFYPQPDDGQRDDEPLEAESPEPRKLLPAHQFYSECDYRQCDYRQCDNESPEADSPEPQRLFPEHQLHSTMYDPQPPQMEILCPKPVRKHATHKVILEPELFEDWFVDMSEIIFIDEETTSPEQSILGTPISEPQTPSPVRCNTPEPEFGDQASLETHGPKPQRFVPVHQSHLRLIEPQPVLELDHEGPESLEIWNLHY